MFFKKSDLKNTDQFLNQRKFKFIFNENTNLFLNQRKIRSISNENIDQFYVKKSYLKIQISFQIS